MLLLIFLSSLSVIMIVVGMFLELPVSPKMLRQYIVSTSAEQYLDILFMIMLSQLLSVEWAAYV